MTSIKFRALTHNDHKLFFEALGEYGKDFQNIQQYMAQKGAKGNSKSSEQSKTSDPQEKREQDKKEEDKKREQIRNFYNKLYTKLSQLVGKLDDRIEKINQELYLLINYGEIWKKHGFKFNNKTKKLLEDLVYQGYTTLRFKNKNVRLRTPSCKALKKINEIGIDEKVKVVTTRELPKDVIVEFHPATNRDWLKVQSVSQNPRVRAKLSMQKRLSNLLEFLENKWNISQDKLNRTIDVWLKVAPNNQSLEDLQTQPPNNNTSNGNFSNQNHRPEMNNVVANSNGTTVGDQTQPVSSCDIHHRLRLKPSPKHELKEVNITRVVPDNHLDLSLNAYINRLNESNPEKQANKTLSTNKAPTICVNSTVIEDGNNIPENHLELSQGAMSYNSRLPISLTTPDSSILLERSYTSDQPSIAQARKHLNLLQTLAGSFEGCENSRTACEDTQDRTLLTPLKTLDTKPCGFGAHTSSVAENECSLALMAESIRVNKDIPALFDEDAAIDTNLPIGSSQAIDQQGQNLTSQTNLDSQNSKSVDFNIPKNVTLGDWFKMAGHGNGVSEGAGDDANDAFPVNTTDNCCDDSEKVFVENDSKEEDKKDDASQKDQAEQITNNTNVSAQKPQNHMIEMKKLAEGWTRQDESSMTVGELYLAFKCPEKIILEYQFEQFTYDSHVDQQATEQSGTNAPVQPPLLGTTKVQDCPCDSALIFKLLTAASLSLTQIERQKQELQHKLHEQQPCSKLKRRKGSGQGHGMTLLDIETTNQRVEEALKQLQPTRLSVYRRAR